VRFELARTRSLAETFESFENPDADDCGEGGRSDCGVTLWAAEDKNENRGGVPDPTVAEARGGNHPDANPARRAPTIEPPHDTVIAALDETPDIAGNGHSAPRRKKKQTQSSGFAQIRVEIPETPRSRLARVGELCPPFAEANFVHPMARSDCWEKHSQREQRERPRLFAEHGAGDAKNVAGNFGEAAVIAMNTAVACSQAGEKFIDSARSGDFRVRKRNARKGV